MDYIKLQDVCVTDPTFARAMRIIKQKMIPYQWEAINDRVPGAEKSHCIENMRIAAGESEGDFYGAVFQDSDVYKWLEAVAYSLIVFPDEELEKLADDVIALIGRAQQKDGYLNTFYIIKEPENRWTNLMEGHELYCAGHMIEAAVAYHQATEKRAFLNIACKMADCIEQVFRGADAHKGYPGHPEIEVALFRLATEANEPRYNALAQHFLNVRGVGECWFEQERRRGKLKYISPEMETFGPDYFQSDKPVREMRMATGHAVRAMYLYSAMADSTLLTGEASLREACEALYQDVVSRQMYITGAVGSASHGERFTSAYDLPNDTIYGETCASVGLMMFSRRMFQLNRDARCFDVWERALKNTVLSGMSQDGRHFFYVNPLEVNPNQIAHDPTRHHVKPERQAWFGVSCCPTNIARTILSIGGSLYATENGSIYLLSHMPSEAKVNGRLLSLRANGDEYTLTISGDACACYLRIPEGATLSLAESQNGFACLEHPGGTISYRYSIKTSPVLMIAHPRVREDAFKAAILEGDTVYCLEQIDNGEQLCEIAVDANVRFEQIDMDFLPEGMHALRFEGYRVCEKGWNDKLYRAFVPMKFERVTLIAIPYSQWNNRGIGEMTVWVHLLSR